VTSEDGVEGSWTLAVLKMLAAEATTARIEALLRDARQHGLPPDQRAEFEHAARLALDARAASEQRRKREAGLISLIDTAQELAAANDLDRLLSVVTNHARRLLELDMAYVSLSLADGGSYVRRSDGETTALSTGLRMGSGLGIGELAQLKRAPIQTPDYLADGQFTHDSAIDEVVTSEGLRAIVAVPMTHTGPPMGALYGASRDVRHFSPDEVSLLRSMAALAASAIETSRTLSRVRTDAEETRAAHARLTEALEGATALAETRDRLAEAVLSGGDLRQVVSVAASALGGAVRVRDAAGRTLASVGTLPEEDRAEVVRVLADANTTGEPVAVGPDTWAIRLVTGTDDPAVLLFERPSPLVEDCVRLVRATGQAVGLALLLRNVAAASPARDEWLADLVEGRTPPGRLVERARMLGIDPSVPHVVLVLSPEPGRLGEAATWASSYAFGQSGHRVVRDGSVVLVLPGTDASTAARAAAERVSRQLGRPVAVGGAGPAHDLDAVARTHREARRCLEALVALGGAGGSAAAGDLGFLGLLLSDERGVDEFVDSALGPILVYDAHRQTDLRHTLDVYFAEAGSPTRAARSLHVHANTVARRLDRIAELLGPDWQSPANALEIQLALRLLRTRNAVNSPREG
jgi:diguanylate cyclase with GGDEF domain/PucR-like helix-turn-helix protein/GAF domain-containing protein